MPSLAVLTAQMPEADDAAAEQHHEHSDDEEHVAGGVALPRLLRAVGVRRLLAVRVRWLLAVGRVRAADRRAAGSAGGTAGTGGRRTAAGAAAVTCADCPPARAVQPPRAREAAIPSIVRPMSTSSTRHDVVEANSGRASRAPYPRPVNQTDARDAGAEREPPPAGVAVGAGDRAEQQHGVEVDVRVEPGQRQRGADGGAAADAVAAGRLEGARVPGAAAASGRRTRSGRRRRPTAPRRRPSRHAPPRCRCRPRRRR